MSPRPTFYPTGVPQLHQTDTDHAAVEDDLRFLLNELKAIDQGAGPPGMLLRDAGSISKRLRRLARHVEQGGRVIEATKIIAESASLPVQE